jgi:translation initiation factor 2B subunit (eIF-2B alpha/beta/delta family)
MTFSQTENRILKNNRSGSSEIYELTLKYILRYLNDSKLAGRRLTHLRKFNRAVMERFASMTIVQNGLGQVGKMLVKYNVSKQRPEYLIEKIEKALFDFNNIDEKVIYNCREIFKKKVRIVTYSQSGLVKKVLAFYRSKIKSVAVSEARPIGEGRSMAEYLAGLGIEVKLCVDMMLPEFMHGGDYFMIGADAVGPDNFVNKIGTKLLLKAAREERIKSIVLYESLKKITRNPSRSKIIDEAGEEVYGGKRRNHIEAVNRYFEIIPNRLVDKFISDKMLHS